MDYNINDIEKILNFTSWTPRKKIDTLLHMDCIMYAQLGIDSTKKEKEEVKKNSRKIYRGIRVINKRLGDEFLLAMDKSEL